MRTILTLGDARLTRRAAPVRPPDAALPRELAELHAVLARFRAEHRFGRALAAPQIGISKRFIAFDLGGGPFTVVNPTVEWRSPETFEVWDDCLSVPDLVVRVRRHRSITLRFEDEQGRVRRWAALPEDLSELVQHELDHLDGVLMTSRAVGDDALRPSAERAALVEASRPARTVTLASIPCAAG